MGPGCYHFGMSRAGFVLVGGRSRRMGCDKARLPYRNGTLVGYLAGEVARAAGNVCLVGAPERYLDLPFPVIGDLFAGAGPVAGIHTALAVSQADWNLVVACDMPELTAEFLTALLDRAERARRQGLVPVSPDGRIQPLCAVYHRACLTVFEWALLSGRRQLAHVVAQLDLIAWPVPEARWFRNVNTPADWAAVTGR